MLVGLRFMCVYVCMWKYVGLYNKYLYIYTYIPARVRFYEGVYFTLPYVFYLTL